MGHESYDEIWGYTCEQIRDYLLEAGAVKNGDIYCTDGCSIRLESLPDRNAGVLALPRTRVCMEGVCAGSFHHAFLLHFLSGGG